MFMPSCVRLHQDCLETFPEAVPAPLPLKAAVEEPQKLFLLWSPPTLMVCLACGPSFAKAGQLSSLCFAFWGHAAWLDENLGCHVDFISSTGATGMDAVKNAMANTGLSGLICHLELIAPFLAKLLSFSCLASISTRPPCWHEPNA